MLHSTNFYATHTVLVHASWRLPFKGGSWKIAREETRHPFLVAVEEHMKGEHWTCWTCVCSVQLFILRLPKGQGQKVSSNPAAGFYFNTVWTLLGLLGLPPSGPTIITKMPEAQSDEEAHSHPWVHCTRKHCNTSIQWGRYSSQGSILQPTQHHTDARGSVYWSGTQSAMSEED